jgi:hypothetical protein
VIAVVAVMKVGNAIGERNTTNETRRSDERRTRRNVVASDDTMIHLIPTMEKRFVAASLQERRSK